MTAPRNDRATVCRWWPALLAAALAGSCQKAEPPAPPPPTVMTRSGIEMVAIPAGWFEMGGRSARPDESPVHRVWVDAFLIDRCEITQKQYGKRVLGNPAHFKGPDRPVEQVSWADAALYCNKRSRAEGLRPCYNEDTAACNFGANGYRLPTEAEWEYACRAGTGSPYHFGRDPRRLRAYAWYKANAARQTHPVATRKPNPWGLYDLYGNVAEWCNDVYVKGYAAAGVARNPRGPAEGEQYVLRGGAWNSGPEVCRSAWRAGEDPGFQDACFSRDAIGFRCVRKAPTGPGPRGSSGPAGEAAPGRTPRTGFVYDDVYLRHKTGEGHPERPERLTAIVHRLTETGLLKHLAPIAPRRAASAWLTTEHTLEYVARVAIACRQGAPYIDTPDVPVSRASYDVAAEAAGGVLAAVDAVMAGRVRNAFCAVRPPGHHALKDKAMGFCLFNNVAIAARYVQKNHRLAKVLIVDWDVHHGNGTQAMTYGDPTVLYFSVHQHPFYPGTGAAQEKGEGAGLGFTVNVPLAAASGDAAYRKAFKEVLAPAARRFRPDFVLISAGFDAHAHDPLGGMKVTAEGFADLTRIVKRIAATSARGRIVSVLEGGYDLKGLAASVEAHLRALMEP